jgi:hypothetical protein
VCWAQRRGLSQRYAARRPGPGDGLTDRAQNALGVLEVGPHHPDHLVAESTQAVLAALLGHEVVRAGVPHQAVELDEDHRAVDDEVCPPRDGAVLDRVLRGDVESAVEHDPAQQRLTRRLGPGVGQREDPPDRRTVRVPREARDRPLDVVGRDERPMERGVGGDQGVERSVELAGLDDRLGERHGAVDLGADHGPRPVARRGVGQPSQVDAGEVRLEGRQTAQDQERVVARTDPSEVADQRRGAQPVASRVVHRPLDRVPAAQEPVALSRRPEPAQLRAVDARSRGVGGAEDPVAAEGAQVHGHHAGRSRAARPEACGQRCSAP